MKKTNLFASVLMAGALLTVIACNNNSSTSETTTDTTSTTMAPMGDSMTTTAMDTAAADHAEANISGTFQDTAVNGTAKFEKEDNGKVKLELELTIPAKANKSVAVHIHEHGDCGDTAKNAHGHWNPTGAQHGKWGSASFHVGDIGNVKLDKDGKGKMELETDLWSIGGSDEKKNILNRSIIVHGGVDDYTSQPSGNSGTRIGCGLISAKR